MPALYEYSTRPSVLKRTLITSWTVQLRFVLGDSSGTHHWRANISWSSSVFAGGRAVLMDCYGWPDSLFFSQLL